MIIKQKDIKVCDICKDPRNSSRMSAGIHIKRDALDWDNTPCADASSRFDMCDKCAELIFKAINDASEPVRPIIEMDGNEHCAKYPDFINLQESPAGFGKTPEIALECLIREVAK